MFVPAHFHQTTSHYIIPIPSFIPAPPPLHHMLIPQLMFMHTQTSSRRSAALWLCHVHNQVNARLKKPEFDCAHLDEEYDCGCGDEPISKKAQPQDVDDVNNSNKDKKEDNDNKKKDGGGSDPDARKVQDEEVRVSARYV